VVQSFGFIVTDVNPGRVPAGVRLPSLRIDKWHANIPNIFDGKARPIVEINWLLTSLFSQLTVARTRRHAGTIDEKKRDGMAIHCGSPSAV
jgi:hypothetical protein